MVVIPAQDDTGANVSATNSVSIIHNYFEYDKLVEVGVFLEETKKDITLQVLGQGIMKIISDQGSVIQWSILYKPNKLAQ